MENASESFTAVFVSRFGGCGYRGYWLECGVNDAVSLDVLCYVRPSIQERRKLLPCVRS